MTKLSESAARLEQDLREYLAWWLKTCARHQDQHSFGHVYLQAEFRDGKLALVTQDDKLTTKPGQGDGL